MSDSIGSVSVEVVPDARGFTEKLRAQIRDPKVTVNADADTTAANAELDKTARTRTARIKVNVDKNPLEQGASALDSFTSKLGLLPALAIAGGAALVPLAGALGGIAAALAAPLAIAGGGATLFGVLAGFAVKDTEKQLKVIDAAQKKLDGLTKGTKEYAAQAKVLADAQKSLSPAQRGFSDAQSSLGASFQNFIGGKAGTALLAPLTQGMTLLSHLLPSLTPVIVAASGAFSTLLGDIGKAASSPGFDKFIHTVSGQVGHDIVGFGRSAGSIAQGLGSLFVILDKSVGSSLVDELVRLTGSFSHWATSKRGADAIHGFLDYFHQVGPQVADTVGAVARGIGHLVTALAPLGPPTLRVIQGIADAISGIPTPVLTALLAGAAGTVAFGKVGGFKAAPSAFRLGQNALSAVTGGLVPGAGGKGVVPVYVTNEGFGGGGGGGPKSTAGKVVQFAEKHPYIAAGGEIVVAAAVAATLGYIALHAQGDPAKPASPGYRNSPAGMSPADTKAFNDQRIAANFAPQPSSADFRATTTGLDSIRAHAASASRAVDMIGPRAENSLGRAVHAVQVLGSGPSGLDSLRAHAAAGSRALEITGSRGAAGVQPAIRAVASLNDKLQAIHDRKFAIVAQTASAIQALERLQAMTIRDKSFNVIQNNIERNVGPGGGMQHHALGGWVTGPGSGTSDSVVMRASAGEYVMDARTAAANRPLLDQMRGTGRTYNPGQAGGGMGGRMRATIHVDGREFGAWVDMRADGVYSANQGHARDVYGPL